METYRGVLHAWLDEPEREGLEWVLLEDGKEKYYEALKIIENGDHLKVYGENGEVLFDGEIIEDRKAGWQEYPNSPGRGQPFAIQFWIYWTQEGWEPDLWASLFLHQYVKGSNGKPLRAELTKKDKPQA